VLRGSLATELLELLELLVGQVGRKRFRLRGGKDHGSSGKGRVAQQLADQQDEQAGRGQPAKEAMSESARSGSYRFRGIARALEIEEF